MRKFAIEKAQQQRKIEQAQRQHAASEARTQRQELALEEQSTEKQGNRIWIIPEFDADRAESEYIIETIRDALPEYYCQLAHAPELTEEDVYQLMAENSPTGNSDE
ncbi:hypothetical protein JMJ58_14980 [Haloterrigena salifodinae]|uniref:Uncharacterized protein n=1 Tax=Haloterrigena salifodinae TaxID=2675099 RepID=A0A8T8DXC5_9EURY|nr:hypothetical protein [Haloterrigena salifodinae]QRV14238.1 hypothetical protein JMJ58_14980 [Haloterrigena salifodinae]